MRAGVNLTNRGVCFAATDRSYAIADLVGAVCGRETDTAVCLLHRGQAFQCNYPDALVKIFIPPTSVSICSQPSRW